MSNKHFLDLTGLSYFYNKLKSVFFSKSTGDAHVSNTDIHVTTSDKTNWNNKQAAGNYVTTDTQQTITAQKSFNSRVNFLGTGDANAIYLTTDTRIDVNGTSYTVLGFGSGTFIINHTNYNLRLRGKGTRPAYNTDTNLLALLSDVPTKVSDLTNDSGFITSYTETDPIFSSSPAAGISSSDITYWNNKQEKITAKKYIGSMYRNNVNGGGSISISGTRGQFPVVTDAGTYVVSVYMSSTTLSYGISVNFGTNSYTVNTTDGIIDDTRQLTVEANARWSASVVGSVGGGTILSVGITTEGQDVTEIGLVAVTNSYEDLDDKPTIPDAQIQADWNQTTTTAKDYIKNKPSITQINSPIRVITISGFSNSIVVGDGVSIGRNGSMISIGSSPSDNDTITLTSNGVDGGVYVSTTDAKFYYNNKEVATKNDIPTVPTNVSAFTNDAGYLTSFTETDPIFSASPAADIEDTDIDSWNAKVSNVQADWNATSGLAQILNRPSVTTSPSNGSTALITSGGVYSHTNNSTIHVTAANKTTWNSKTSIQWDTLGDGVFAVLPLITLENTPTNNSNNLVTSGGVYTALNTKANTADLATVATSGSYNDLTDKPTIPAATTIIFRQW